MPNWDRVKQVFQEVLDRPAPERAAYLRELCGDDGALRSEVESLLANHQQAGSFAERPEIELLDALAPGTDSGSASTRRVVHPGDRLGVYEIQALVGAGGMGEVYKARDTRLDRTVAIKVLPLHLAEDRDRYQRFEREARAVASLDHPHIGALYDVGQDGGVQFLVMQYLDGETLAARLAKGPLPIEQALRYAIDIANALDHAHRRGIVHRDLKPGNIILTKSGATLLDFGLAKWRASASGLVGGLTAAATAHDSLTERGTIVGTLHYMAPEQLEGKDTDARTDLFAFGVVVYEMVTGRKAFEGTSSASIVAAILDTQPPSISTVRPLTPPALDNVVKTCLAKDPDERWQSAGDLARQLRWIAESGSQAPAITPVDSQRNRRTAQMVAVVALLAAGLVGAAIARSSMRARSASVSLQVTRSIVSTPRELWVDQNLALAPDGSRLAYIAGDRLYVRALDELDSKPISGVEYPSFPFFSPDSRWLGFFARGKLMKVASSGGPPQTICETPGGGGGRNGATWGPDDTIVFTSSHRTGLVRVPAAGGTPQILTTLNTDRHEKSHRFPQFLPEGRALLFDVVTAEMTSPDEGRIEVLSLATGERRTLLEGGTSPRYASTGHLVYARGGSLFAVAFDPRRLEIRGQPVSVLDGVSASFSGVAAFNFSQHGLLAYIAGHPNWDTSIVSVDRQGKVQPLIETRRPYYNVEISPDGQQLALSIIALNDQVWLYDLARRTMRRLTFAWDNRAWAWTPDGRRIVFSSDRSGSYNFYWQDPEGGGPAERLTDSPHSQEVGSWSPDGKAFAFGDDGVTTQGDIWLLTLDPERRVRPLIQTPFDEGDPMISPDGRWLAYYSDESGRYEVYLQSFPDLGRKWQVSTEGGEGPRWAPRGHELFYRNLDKLMAVPIGSGLAAPVGAPRLLFEGRYGNYAVAPDERFIMIRPETALESSQITLVQNWFEELKRRVPTP
jgi:serine/threonine protein kinase/WD40 repeat protein